jgi:hypothetical protein
MGSGASKSKTGSQASSKAVSINSHSIALKPTAFVEVSGTPKLEDASPQGQYLHASVDGPPDPHSSAIRGEIDLPIQKTDSIASLSSFRTDNPGPARVHRTKQDIINGPAVHIGIDSARRRKRVSVDSKSSEASLTPTTQEVATVTSDPAPIPATDQVQEPPNPDARLAQSSSQDSSNSVAAADPINLETLNEDVTCAAVSAGLSESACNNTPSFQEPKYELTDEPGQRIRNERITISTDSFVEASIETPVLQRGPLPVVSEEVGILISANESVNARPPSSSIGRVQQDELLRVYAENIFYKADCDADLALNEWEFLVLVQSPTLALGMSDAEAREILQNVAASPEAGITLEEFVPVMKDLMIQHCLVKKERNLSGWQWFIMYFDDVDSDLLTVFYNTIDDIMTYDKPTDLQEMQNSQAQDFETLVTKDGVVGFVDHCLIRE